MILVEIAGNYDKGKCGSSLLASFGSIVCGNLLKLMDNLYILQDSFIDEDLHFPQSVKVNYEGKN